MRLEVMWPVLMHPVLALSLDLSLPDTSLPDLSLVESALSSLSATEVSLLLVSLPLLLIAGGLWKPVPEAEAGQPPPGEGLLSGFLDAGRTGGYTADYGQPRVRSGNRTTPWVRSQETSLGNAKWEIH